MRVRQHRLAAEPLRGRLAGGSGFQTLVESKIVRAWLASENSASASPPVGNREAICGRVGTTVRIHVAIVVWSLGRRGHPSHAWHSAFGGNALTARQAHFLESTRRRELGIGHAVPGKFSATGSLCPSLARGGPFESLR